MEQLIPGTVTELTVAREASFGYFLTNGKEDVLLHQSEITEEVNINDVVQVFLYQDKLGRLAATMTIPRVQIGKFDWCEVVEVKEDFGVFINIGINKDILLHKYDLPKVTHVWPEIGGKLYCSLKLDNYGGLLAKLANEKDMEEHLFKKADRSVFNKNVTGIVYRTLYSGTFIITEEGYRGFIHESQRKTEPRIGQTVKGRIIDVKNDGSVNVSLLKRSHESLNEDAEMLYQYLLERGGKMPYGDKSHPDDIKNRFGLSKAAFKRALGHLMKEDKIIQEEGWTKLK